MVCLELKNYAITFLFLKKKSNRRRTEYLISMKSS